MSKLEDCFALLEKCAVVGERCPFNFATGGHPLMSGATLTLLARAGRIRVEIGQKNWRVVTILRGNHAGAHTAYPSGAKWRAYKVITNETRINGRIQQTGPRTHSEPSKPREIF